MQAPVERSRRSSGTERPLARIFEKDPDLLRHVDAETAATARRLVTAEVETVKAGDWSPPEDLLAPELIGLLVLEGVLVRRVEVAGQESAELLGQGDLLRPWQHHGLSASVPAQTRWKVVEPAQLAVIDQELGLAFARLPGATSELMGRVLERSRLLSSHLAIARLRRLDARLLLLLWALADRWGRRDRDGVIVDLRLSHEVLGELVCARRQSVTAAMKALAERGLVTRTPQGGWRLRGAPPRSSDL